MTWLAVPFDSDATSVIYEVTLDETTYRLLYRWNAREAAWYLTLSDTDDVVIVASRKLVPGSALLRYVADFDTRPPGELMCEGRPTLETLGSDSYLVYADEATAEAWRI